MKVSINGREMDLTDLESEVLNENRVQDWTSSQGLNQNQANEFRSALSDVLKGIANGNKYEHGKYAGDGNRDKYYGKFTGNEKDGPVSKLGIKRNAYDAYGNVVAYINSRYNNVKSSTSEEEAKKNEAKLLPFGLASFSNHVRKNLFGLAPDDTIDLNKWADKSGDVADEKGVRSTINRRKKLTEALRDFNLEKYDLSDEDKIRYKKTLAELDENGSISEDALMRLGLGHYLYSNTKPLSDEEKKQQEEKKKLEELKAKQDAANKGYNDWLNQSYGNDITSNLLYDNNLTSEHQQKIDNIIANGYDWDNFLSNLSNDVNSNFSNINDEGKFKWTSHGVYPGSYYDGHKDNIDIFGKEFTDAFDPYAFNYSITGSSVFKPSEYRKLAYNNFLARAKETGDLNKYKVGNNQYIIPQSMDADGNVLIYNYSTTNPSITKTNIRKFKDRTDLVDLWNEISQRYAKLHNVNLNLSLNQNQGMQLPFNKLGGVLKAALGDSLVAQKKAKDAEEQEMFASMSPEERKQYKEDNREITMNSLSLADKARISGIALDLTSALAAFAPGAGTGVSLATGLTSTGANLIADISEGKGAGTTLKNLGIGLGLDVAGSLAGVGAGAKTGKIVKSLVSVAPRLIALATAANMAPEFINTLTEVTKTGKMNAKQLKTLAFGMSALAGGARVIGGHMNSSAIKEAAKTGNSLVNVKGKNGIEQIKLKTADAEKLAKASTKAEADAIIKSAKGEGYESLFTDKKEFAWKKPSTYLSRSKNDSNITEELDLSRVKDNGDTWRWVEGLGNLYAKLGFTGAKRTNLDIFKSRYNFGTSTTNSPFKSRYTSNHKDTQVSATSSPPRSALDILSDYQKQVKSEKNMPNNVYNEQYNYREHNGSEVNYRRNIDVNNPYAEITPKGLSSTQALNNIALKSLGRPIKKFKYDNYLNFVKLLNKIGRLDRLNDPKFMKLSAQQFDFKEGGLIPKYSPGGFFKWLTDFVRTGNETYYDSKNGTVSTVGKPKTTVTSSSAPDVSTPKRSVTATSAPQTSPTSVTSKESPVTSPVSPATSSASPVTANSNIPGLKGGIDAYLKDAMGEGYTEPTNTPANSNKPNTRLYETIYNAAKPYITDIPLDEIDESELDSDPSKMVSGKQYDFNGDKKSFNNPMGLPETLELMKYFNTAATNKKIDDIQLEPVHKIFPQEYQRHHGIIDYLTRGWATNRFINNQAHQIAEGSSDLGMGNAVRLNALGKIANNTLDFTGKYANSVLDSEKLVTATENNNTKLRVPIANENVAADVAAENQQKVKHMQRLNKDNANFSNLANTMLYGNQVGAEKRYANQYADYLETLPEYKRYKDYEQRIAELSALDPDFDYTKEYNGKAGVWSTDDVSNYALTNSKLYRLGEEWRRKNPFRTPQSFSNMSFYKDGGKTKAAEEVKSRRAAAKLFFDTIKLTTTESNRSIKNSSAASLYLLKRMMQGK